MEFNYRNYTIYIDLIDEDDRTYNIISAFSNLNSSFYTAPFNYDNEKVIKGWIDCGLFGRKVISDPTCTIDCNWELNEVINLIELLKVHKIRLTPLPVNFIKLEDFSFALIENKKYLLIEYKNSFKLIKN